MNAGEEGGADGQEEVGSKTGKGKGKARDIVSIPTDSSDRNTTGEAPIEILNIARDDIKPKIIKMLLGRNGSGNQGSSSSSSSKHQQPDILVSTPSRLLQLLQKKGSEAGSGLDLSNLESLVIDEADFMLAYGHDMLGSSEPGEDGSTSSGGFIKQVLQAGWWTKAEAKGGVQRFLISATLNSDVEKLKGLVLRRPVVLDMKDSLLASADSSDASAQNQQQLLQYSLHLSEVDKFLLLYVILKLRLIRGKTLIFVNSIERGYRLKLFLEQFGITKSAVLNHELPFNTRMKKVEAFNKDAIAVMIATDEVGAAEGMQDVEEDDSEEEEEEANEAAGKKRKRGDAGSKEGKQSAKKQKNGTAATEYSVSRGVDFLQVACVINFDMPTSLTAYTHRVGRTARAGNTGTALSFVVPKALVGNTTGQLSGKNMKHLCCSTARLDESVWKKVQVAYAGATDAEKSTANNTIQEWKYDKAQIEAFRYRMEDALRSVTKLAIKDARVKELKWEMLNSEKLKSYWEDNPKDLEYLKAQTQDLSGGKMLGSGKVQSHLKHVPGYLMPRIAGFKSGSGSTGNGQNGGRSSTGYVPKHGKKAAGKGNGKKQFGGKKKSDPLKKFKSK